MDNFKGIKYFKKSEFHRPEMMDRNFLLKLDAYRKFTDMSLLVTSSTDGLHTQDSPHYLGLAVDIIPLGMKQKDKTLFQMYLDAERFGFCGIGIYPHWKYKGVEVGGLHLDHGKLFNKNRARRWMGIKDQNGKQSYIALNEFNLKQYKVI